ncbi:hypothetical protein Ancab_035750 [Ancistrocladus abbreviatus]
MRKILMVEDDFIQDGLKVYFQEVGSSYIVLERPDVGGCQSVSLVDTCDCWNSAASVSEICRAGAHTGYQSSVTAFLVIGLLVMVQSDVSCGALTLFLYIGIAEFMLYNPQGFEMWLKSYSCSVHVCASLENDLGFGFLIMWWYDEKGGGGNGYVRMASELGRFAEVCFTVIGGQVFFCWLTYASAYWLCL